MQCFLILAMAIFYLVTAEDTLEEYGHKDNMMIYKCPKTFNTEAPWEQDADNCACYFVCNSYGSAVHMCCPEGTWWNNSSRRCDYISSFSIEKRANCKNAKPSSYSNAIGSYTPDVREIFRRGCYEYRNVLGQISGAHWSTTCDRLFNDFAKYESR